MYLIVGLGNPGDKYIDTRHNVGWKVLDGVFGDDAWSKSKGTQAFYKHDSFAGEHVEILKPTSYMNASGSPVEYTRNKHDIDTSKVIVIHDDISLPFGEYVISFKKGAGGHNGIKSIISHLGTDSFVRLRVGIAPTHLSSLFERKTSSLSGFVLGRFSGKEKKELENSLTHVREILSSIVSDGVHKAMNIHNQKMIK